MSKNGEQFNGGENQTDEKSNSSVSSESVDELMNFKKICHARCSICRSGVLKEIHDHRKNGMQFDAIVEKIKTENNVAISSASLSRHFKSYRAFKTEIATKVIKQDMLEEITLQSVHIKKTVELLDLAYAQLLVKFQSQNYNIDIADLEKLTKIRYQVLTGENVDDNQLMAIFQKASNDYGLNIEQGVLFKPGTI